MVAFSQPYRQQGVSIQEWQGLRQALVQRPRRSKRLWQRIWQWFFSPEGLQGPWQEVAQQGAQYQATHFHIQGTVPFPSLVWQWSIHQYQGPPCNKSVRKNSAVRSPMAGHSSSSKTDQLLGLVVPTCPSSGFASSVTGGGGVGASPRKVVRKAIQSSRRENSFGPENLTGVPGCRGDVPLTPRGGIRFDI
jgi:hypothetical protein